MSNQRFACIMAGGSGTRFWPQSRAALPKQFLAFQGSEESLLQATVRRIRGLLPVENVYVVTSHRHVAETTRQLPDLPVENVLGEPAGRNTAPCVGWAAAHVRARDPQGLMAVLPADPYITDEAGYVATLDKALCAAEQGSMVTVGIRPTRPETGYGYIECGAPLGDEVAVVAKFIEKPPLEVAERFVQEGKLWNSGMFFFRCQVILDQIATHQPQLSAFLSACSEAIAQGNERTLVEAQYAALPSISIDHGIMEKAQAGSIHVVQGDFGWHDVGSWTSAWELSETDNEGNATVGKALLLDTQNCYVRGPSNKLIAIVGMSDLVVVDTPDALLIVPRERAQDVKKIVTHLKESQGDKYI